MELQDGAINLTEQEIDKLAGEQLTNWSVTTLPKYESTIKRLAKLSRHLYVIEPCNGKTMDELDFFKIIAELVPKIKAESAAIKVIERKLILFEFPLDKRIKVMRYETAEFRATKIKLKDLYYFIPNYGLI